MFSRVARGIVASGRNHDCDRSGLGSAGVLRVIEPFRRRDGSYRIENVFRIAIAKL